MIRPSYFDWLIPPYDRADLDSLAVKGFYPVLDDLLPSFGYAFLFGVARIFFTYYAFKPLAIFALKIPQEAFISNHLYEHEIKNIKNINSITDAELEKIAASVKTTTEAVRKYIFNKRLHKSRVTKITKFVEAMWRFIFYLYFIFLGSRILVYPQFAEWVVDTRKHFLGWPFHPIPPLAVFFHQIQIGCYIHQLMWTEVSRSDSKEMIVHHLTTITLVLISHLLNFHRIGSLVFYVHDLSDVFLESAKCFNYMSKVKGQKFMGTISDVLFALFALSFFVLRLIVYPKYCVYSLVVEGKEILGTWPGYYFISILLSVLICLHVYWFSLISKMIFKLLTTGIEKDERSDDDDVVEDEKED